MDIKMTSWATKVCNACLSDNRNLHPLCKLQPILNEIQFLELNNLIGGICWECRRLVLKIQKFKKQVHEAQNILYHKLERKYLGNLDIISKNQIDYKYQYSSDPLVSSDTIVKHELCCVKDEQNTYKDDNCELANEDYMTDSTEDIKNGIDTEETKLAMTKYFNSQNDRDGKNCSKRILRLMKRKLRKVKSTDAKDEELRDKFTTVIFSENEMIRNREEKRSQPNFKKIPYKCDSCVLGFTRKETYDLHYEKKHDESIGQYCCPVCSTRFSNPRAMEAHRGRHYSCYRCTLCKYETLQWGSAVAHCSAKHAADRSGRIHCGQCGFVARTAEDLVEHKRMQHTLYCNECGEKFKGKHTLRTHKIRIHKSNRDYVCDICNKTFKTKSRLESHMVSHNATLAQKLSYCSVCNIQYKNIYVYRNHLKNSANHSERLYHCQDCDKRFASKVYWQKHCDFYHLKKSQFKCGVCNKLLISEWRLKNHMQTRHGSTRTRNHGCDVCEKKFFTVSTLRAHQQTHSSQRSYMCEQCGDTFKQRAALHTHTRALHTHARALHAHTHAHTETTYISHH